MLNLHKCRKNKRINEKIKKAHQNTQSYKNLATKRQQELQNLFLRKVLIFPF